ncbi:NUDIX domain-containing protein [Actinoplanes sp. NPDC049668]
MTERVRAALITPATEILLIRRTRAGAAPYWVLPGGQRANSDASPEDALRREIHEGLAGEPEIDRLIQITGDTHDRQYLYLARITHWSFTDRTGPGISRHDGGTYELDRLPLTAAALAAVDLKPAQTAAFLSKALTARGSLFTLSDLRCGR